MLKNMESSRGLVFSQRVLLELVERGLSREKAYELVQRNAMLSVDEETDFRELLKLDEGVTAYLPADELTRLFDYGYYLRNVPATFNRIGLGQPAPTMH